jgi:hypothetical protein
LGLELAWFHHTKEKLSSRDVLIGLLDYGLFAEKVPPCFSSQGLADLACEILPKFSAENIQQVTIKEFDKCAHDYVRYESLRDINIPRHLGIPHPEAYAAQAFVLSNNWRELAEHCNRPKLISTRIYVRHIGDGSIFDMSYKGDDHFYFEETELNWMAGVKFVVEADIAACFPSIYTHGIPWALHGKKEAKRNPQCLRVTGNSVDRATRNTRDKQTNGLLIGPHASNLISEIILTQIDASLQKKYLNFVRYIDDYKFYAKTLDEAELFLKELGMNLRLYEMSLNEKKTKILPYPRPADDNWQLVLTRFNWPKDTEIEFTTIRSFIDLALECAQAAKKSSPLNYAIKVIGGKGSPRKLSRRAMRMYVQTAINLALAYPYLAPLLDEFVFDKYWHDGLQTRITSFATNLINIGVKKLYPDTIAHALYLAIKHNLLLSLPENELVLIISLDDCVANVLLLEYAKKNSLNNVITAVERHAKDLKDEANSQDIDRQWLLIYQVWSVAELKGKGQGFLANLKARNFEFFRPLITTKYTSDVDCVEYSHQ